MSAKVWYEGGRGEGYWIGERGQSVMVLYGEMEKDFCPNSIQNFFENIPRRSRND